MGLLIYGACRSRQYPQAGLQRKGALPVLCAHVLYFCWVPLQRKGALPVVCLYFCWVPLQRKGSLPVVCAHVLYFCWVPLQSKPPYQWSIDQEEKFASAMLLYERVRCHVDGIPATDEETPPLSPDQVADAEAAGICGGDGEGSKLEYAQRIMTMATKCDFNMTDLSHYYYTVYRKGPPEPPQPQVPYRALCLHPSRIFGRPQLLVNALLTLLSVQVSTTLKAR